ncbi:hypothetical protein [Gilliamella apis]|uniref:Uncharacterized protein n=1 Tax=Gilliamella apis TaxID=1970738 RepID=A0A242NTG8_9GAMM|nr:hypothetical protein [Gilliamella apis]OTQ48949.1 hypothetical protein B6D06_08485 [Gilliamella apis]
MTLLNDILNALGEIDNKPIIEHTFCSFKYENFLKSPNQNLSSDLQKVFKLILSDQLFISVVLTNGVQDPVRFTSNNIEDFQRNASDFFQNYDEDEKTAIEIESKDHKNLNIFDIDSFTKFLSSKTLEEKLKLWSSFFENNKLVINFYADYETNKNDYIFIHSVYPNRDLEALTNWKESNYNRDKLLNNQIERRDKVSHFVNAVQIPFTPECFYFKEDFFLKSHFDYLRSIFSLVFLSDYTNIDNEIIKFKIKGYKTLNCQLNNKLSDNVCTELFDIYEWVYSEGSFVDKIGIARNVLSIHITDEDISTLESGTCYSAQSGYDLYLKDNVKQYIEVKNKIADMLYNQSEKASGIVKDMFTKFKTSIWTLFSFFILSFLSKAYTKNNLDTSILDILVLNNPIICLGVLLVIFSFCYLLFTYNESVDEINRLKNKYKEIENRYKDLLNEKDLKKILKQSNVDGKSPEEREISYIEEKRKLYIGWWIFINIFLLCLLVIPPCLDWCIIQGFFSKLYLSLIYFLCTVCTNAY